MEEWIALKEAVVVWLGLERTALRVLASVPAVALLAAVLRRPLSSPIPCFCLLILLVGYEAASNYGDGKIEDWEIAGSQRDIPLIMAIPTLLLVFCRFIPRLMVAPRRPAPRLLLPFVDHRSEGIIDAEYEEVAAEEEAK